MQSSVKAVYIFYTPYLSSIAGFSAIYMKSGVKESRFHTPLFKQYHRQVCGMQWEQGVKESRFHTPLFKAVPQTSLRYAVGARCERKALSHSLI